MATESIPMKVLRPYSRGKESYAVGQVFHATEAQAEALEATRPPTGERITDAQAEALETPNAPVDATDGAVALAEELGVDLRAYAGQGSGEGGRIVKSDVERWATGA